VAQEAQFTDADRGGFFRPLLDHFNLYGRFELVMRNYLGLGIEGQAEGPADG
jgi:hypothetical protein